MEKLIGWRLKKLKASLRLKLIHFMTSANSSTTLIAIAALKWFALKHRPLQKKNLFFATV